MSIKFFFPLLVVLILFRSSPLEASPASFCWKLCQLHIKKSSKLGGLITLLLSLLLALTHHTVQDTKGKRANVDDLLHVTPTPFQCPVPAVSPNRRLFSHNILLRQPDFQLSTFAQLAQNIGTRGRKTSPPPHTFSPSPFLITSLAWRALLSGRKGIFYLATWTKGSANVSCATQTPLGCAFLVW